MGIHHYSVAHHVIPSIFFGHPQQFIDLLTNNPRKMHELWDQAGNDIGIKKENSSGLRIDNIKAMGINGIVIIFPETSTEAECIMSACVIESKKVMGLFRRNVPRYVTLEYGYEDDQKPRTVLCEWKSGGLHLNYGNGCKPDVNEFVRRILSLFHQGADPAPPHHRRR